MLHKTCISESPLQFYVNNASSSDLMAHGPGLIYGTSNELAAFTIYNKELALGKCCNRENMRTKEDTITL